MNKFIYTSYSPNSRLQDVLLNLFILLTPWNWFQGSYSKKITDQFEGRFSGSQAFNFNHARSGMYLLFKYLKSSLGDVEVAVQGFTCTAAVNPVLWADLKINYIDIDSDTLNMSLKNLKKKMTSKTKIVVFQHTFGNSTGIEEVAQFCKSRDLILIEDCSHTIFGKHKDKLIGSFGDFAIFSFGRDKAITGVAGGLILINNPLYLNVFEGYMIHTYPSFQWIFRELMYQPLWFVIRNTLHNGIGKIIHKFASVTGILTTASTKEEKIGEMPGNIPHKLPNALARLVFTQLTKIDEFNLNRIAISSVYKNELSLPTIKFVEGNFPLRWPIFLGDKSYLIKNALKEGIQLGSWYSNPVEPADVSLENFGYVKGSCPNAEQISNTVVNLPLHINLKNEQVKRITKFLTLLSFEKVSDSKELDSFLKDLPDKTFFLSKEWLLFEKELGSDIDFILVKTSGAENVVGLLPIKIIKAKRGSYLHLRHGPSINWNDEILVEQVLSYLKNYAKEAKVDFIRISPLLENTVQNKFLLSKYGFKEAPIHATDAQLTLIIDLSQSESEILSAMRKTTRNLIKKAPKVGVKIKFVDDLSLFDDFAKAYSGTVKRNAWNAYSLEYIKKEYEIFSGEGKAWIFVAYYEGIPIAASIFIVDEAQAVYHHSGSLTEFRKIPSVYLLLWEAIKFFKKRGVKVFNFWGVSPKDSKRHPWHGLSLFKRGFSSNEKQNVHSYDLILDPFAYLTRLYEFLEAKRRGYK